MSDVICYPFRAGGRLFFRANVGGADVVFYPFRSGSRMLLRSGTGLVGYPFRSGSRLYARLQPTIPNPRSQGCLGCGAGSFGAWMTATVNFTGTIKSYSYGGIGSGRLGWFAREPGDDVSWFAFDQMQYDLPLAQLSGTHYLPGSNCVWSASRVIRACDVVEWSHFEPTGCWERQGKAKMPFEMWIDISIVPQADPLRWIVEVGVFNWGELQLSWWGSWKYYWTPGSQCDWPFGTCTQIPEVDCGWQPGSSEECEFGFVSDPCFPDPNPDCLVMPGETEHAPTVSIAMPSDVPEDIEEQLSHYWEAEYFRPCYFDVRACGGEAILGDWTYHQARTTQCETGWPCGDPLC